jgi:adenosylhomocysteine nucleosidase
VTRVLVVTAVDLEARGLARHLGLTRVAGRDWPSYRGGALELVCAGPRAAHLAARAAGVESASLVISAGVCGALSPDLAEGDLVVPEAVVAATRRLATANLPELRRAGTLVTVEDIVATPEQKARLWVETGALACDMESAPILEWAAVRGLRAAVVRGVSDRASRGVAADLAAVVEPDGRVRTTRAVRVVLSRPRAIPEAMMLMSGTNAALKSVAAALGRVARTHA